MSGTRFICSGVWNPKYPLGIIPYHRPDPFGQALVAESSVRSRLSGSDAGMSDAEELRKNASICGDLAKRCKSDVERDQWLRMQQSWLALAENREKNSLSKGNGAAPDSSPRDHAAPEQRSQSDTDG